jgi:hypothetical protein
MNLLNHDVLITISFYLTYNEQHDFLFLCFNSGILKYLNILSEEVKIILFKNYLKYDSIRYLNILDHIYSSTIDNFCLNEYVITTSENTELIHYFLNKNDYYKSKNLYNICLNFMFRENRFYFIQIYEFLKKNNLSFLQDDIKNYLLYLHKLKSITYGYYRDVNLVSHLSFVNNSTGNYNKDILKCVLTFLSDEIYNNIISEILNIRKISNLIIDLFEIKKFNILNIKKYIKCLNNKIKTLDYDAIVEYDYLTNELDYFLKQL